MSETKKTTGVQEEAEKEVPETEEPGTEPVERSMAEGTAGENPEAKKKRMPQMRKIKRKDIFLWQREKDNKTEQQIEDLTDR